MVNPNYSQNLTFVEASFAGLPQKRIPHHAERKFLGNP